MIFIAFIFAFIFGVSSEGCQKPFDLIFAIDESGENGHSQFNYVQDFLETILLGDYLNITEDMVHVGFMKFTTVKTYPDYTFCSMEFSKKATGPETETVGDLSGDLDTVYNNFDRMIYNPGGKGTTVGHGLEHTLEMFNTYGRPEILGIIVLYIDGETLCDDEGGPDDGTSFQMEMAEKFKNDYNYKIIIIEVNGAGHDNNVIMASSNGTAPYLFPVTDGNAILGIIPALTTTLCTFEIACVPECINGYCEEVAEGGTECICNMGWGGDSCNVPQCDPVCDSVKQTCAAPQTCLCVLPYEGPPNAECTHSCTPDCGVHALCVDVNTCDCIDPYIGNPPTVPCGIECTDTCGPNSTCLLISDPLSTSCVCDGGHVGDPTTEEGCAPYCTGGCATGATCVNPDECTCDLAGYIGSPDMTSGSVCIPFCTVPCVKNATCVSPDTCECDYGFIGSGTSACVADCVGDYECHTQATCVGPLQCECDYLYEGDGYTVCEPICEVGHCGTRAICVGPNQCECPGGYIGDPNPYIECIPVCNSVTCVLNSSCVAPNVCQCDEDFYGDPYDKCKPICLPYCQSKAECISPDVCVCIAGYIEDEEGVCHPVCTGGCGVHAFCFGPETCACDDQYSGDPEVFCGPVCSFGCGKNAECIEPEVCECDDFYEGDPYTICYPTCPSITCSVYEHGYCSDIDVCSCKDGYVDANEGIGLDCQPVCTGGCTVENSYCASPDTCRCEPEYFGDPYTVCEVGCTNPPCPASGAYCFTRNRCECLEGYVANPIPSTDCSYVCDGVACGAYSHCIYDAETDGPKCICDDGYQDEDNNGDCEFYCEDGLCVDNSDCVGPNFCKCKDLYVGNPYENCEAVCLTQTCAENAYCSEPNVCSCLTGYKATPNATVACIPVCIGGCGENAYCESAGVCQCDLGYGGNPYIYCDLGCTQPPCGENAKCVGLNVCECKSGYSGNPYSFCTPDCGVCGENAYCSSPGNCKCLPGYEGNPYNFCSKSCFPSCGVGAECVELLGECRCLPGYEGDPYYKCIIECNPQCVQHATCTSPSKVCICDLGFYGDGTVVCASYCSEDGCGTNAECVNLIKCECLEGFDGDPYRNCNPVCTDCVENSECVAPGECKCIVGWDGINCDIPTFTCNGLKVEEDGSCSTPNGTCVRQDECKCKKGYYYGNNCQFWDCWSIDMQNEDVCGGDVNKYGRCIAPNTCVCEDAPDKYELNIVKSRCEKIREDFERPEPSTDMSLSIALGSTFSSLIGITVILQLVVIIIIIILVVFIIIKSKKKVHVTPDDKFFQSDSDDYEDIDEIEGGEEDGGDSEKSKDEEKTHGEQIKLVQPVEFSENAKSMKGIDEFGNKIKNDALEEKNVEKPVKKDMDDDDIGKSLPADSSIQEVDLLKGDDEFGLEKRISEEENENEEKFDIGDI